MEKKGRGERGEVMRRTGRERGGKGEGRGRGMVEIRGWEIEVERRSGGGDSLDRLT